MADKVTSIYDLDVTGILSGLDKVATRIVEVDAQLDKLPKNPFKEATAGANQLDTEISQGTQKVAQLESVITSLRAEITQLTAEQNKMAKSMKQTTDSAKYDQLEKDIVALRNEIKRLNSELDKTTQKSQKAGSMLSKIKGGFLGAFTGFSTGGGAGVQAAAAALGTINPVLGVTAGILGSVAEKAAKATSEWQGYNAVLKNSLGSQELATQNLSVLEQLAAKLPFSLNEATESFTQLVNRGFRPTKDEINNLSGFAASQNKTFDQLIQAILDAENGEVERLKEFGIQASNQGNKVKITFRGITKEFEKGALDSASAFAALAKELGSDKLNADKMQTLEGRMSNLNDTADRIARKFGQVLLPVFEALLTISDKLLGVIDDAITGWTSFDEQLKKVSKTGEENAYPTLKKIFDLFKSNQDGRSTVADFMFSLNAGFEKLIASAELLVALMANLNDPAKSAIALANWKKNIDNINKTIAAYYSANQSGGTANGDFVYGPSGPPKPRELTDAEKALIARRANELKDLEKKLADELLRIQNEYGKERLESLRDNELVYIEEKRKYDLQRVDQEQQALLRIKQMIAGAKKGRYDAAGKIIPDASVTLNASETAAFDARRQLINSGAYEEQAKFINDAEKRITEVISNEYQRQLQAAEYKYEELIKLAKKAGVDTVKLEKEKNKEIDAINREHDLSLIEKSQNKYVGGSELDVLQAQIDGRLDLELEARKKSLEIERQFNEEKIKILEKYGDEESLARILPIQKANLEITKQIGDIDKQAHELQIGAVKTVIDSLQEVYQAQERIVQARISRIDDEISKKEEQVKKEQELNEEGVANNLSLRQKELADLKAARERALEDQKRLQRTQLIIDTASQASSMITAASKVFSGFATIPIVGVGLGIAAVALMLGAFAASKIKAFQLVNQQTPTFGDGGEVGGRLHRDGGTLIEAEKGEYVVNRRSTAEYGDLIEAINENRRGDILDYLLDELLSGTGVSLSEAQRRRDMKTMSEYRKVNGVSENELLIREVKRLGDELRRIQRDTSNIPDFSLVPLKDGKVLKKGNKSGSVSVTDYSEMIKK